MAATSDGEGDELISGINVTPLVDITLVLLIVFMVTATYIVRQSIQVQLPRAAHGGETLGKTLMVVIKPDGTLYVDGVALSDSAIVAKVRAAHAVDPEIKAVISADGDCRHRTVIHAIDLFKGAGVTKFALDVEKEVSTSPSSP